MNKKVPAKLSHKKNALKVEVGAGNLGVIQ